MKNEVKLVPRGVRIEFALGTVVTLSYDAAETLAFEIQRQLEKWKAGAR